MYINPIDVGEFPVGSIFAGEPSARGGTGLGGRGESHSESRRVWRKAMVIHGEIWLWINTYRYL